MSDFIVIGEVLFDIMPDGSRKIGGAPFNFAFHLSMLENKVNFISRIGKDDLGKAVLNFIKKWGITDGFVQLDAHHSTGEVNVSIDEQGSPKFHILEDQAYDYIEEPLLRKLVQTKPRLVYFGTLAQRSEVSRQSICNLLNKLSNNSTVFLDLNLRAPYYDSGLIEQSLEYANIVKVSKEELEILMDVVKDIKEKDEKKFVSVLQHKKNIDWICVTKGEKGSYSYIRRNDKVLYQPAYKVDGFVNAMGAGDAYSAMMAHGVFKGWSERVIMKNAAQFSAEMCKTESALPEDKAPYEAFK